MTFLLLPLACCFSAEKEGVQGCNESEGGVSNAHRKVCIDDEVSDHCCSVIVLPWLIRTFMIVIAKRDGVCREDGIVLRRVLVTSAP